ncbi:MAG: hypothetical protein FJZ01_19165 [Candidatus Sericytochromatia bacterium]|nr:hypothetical protein [Candidatus Tanganyikabacteria bacterium]
MKIAAIATLAASLLVPAGAAWAGEPVKAPKVKMGVHGWFYTDPLGDLGLAAPGRTPTAFRVRRANIWISGDATEHMGYNVLFDPSLLLTNSTLTVRGNVSGSAISSSTVTSSYAPLKDAFVYYDRGWFRLQLGQMKVPVSQEFLQGAFNLATIERSMFATSAVTGDFGFYRDIGALASVDLFGMGKWHAGIYNGSGANIAENSNAKTLVTRVELKPMSQLSLGAAYLNGYKRGPTDTAALFRDRYEADVKLDLSPIVLSGEALYGTDGGKAGNPKLGYYGQCLYALSWEHQFVAKFEGWNPDTSATGTSSQQQYSALLGWNWNVGAPGTALMVNYIHDFLPSATASAFGGFLPGGADDRLMTQLGVLI